MKLVLVFALVGLIVVGNGDRSPDPEHRTDFDRTWVNYHAACEAMLALSVWPHEGDLSRQEWMSYMRLAAGLQDLDDEEVESVLRAYMVLGHQRHMDSCSGQEAFDLGVILGWQTRPLLVLRLMFELPDEPIGQDQRRAMADHRVWLHGTIPVEVADLDKPLRRSISAPVAFDGRGFPQIGLRRESSVGWGGGDPYSAYQPHLEYKYFKTLYSKRDLVALIGDAPPPWSAASSVRKQGE